MDHYTTAKLTAELAAQSMEVNETQYHTCPVCNGKSKFSVTRTANNILWNCFRASCPVTGGIAHTGVLTPADKPKPRSKLKPFTGEFHDLNIGERDFLLERFPWLDGVNIWTAFKTDELKRIMMPVYNPQEWDRGYVARTYPQICDWLGPKSVLYMHAEGPTLSWYPVRDCKKLVLVEDQMSAYACKLAGLSACALLGTNLNNGKVREIAMQRPEEVIIALDADATEQAFALARKWGLAFKKTRVAVLKRDLKDEHDLFDIPEVLGI